MAHAKISVHLSGDDPDYDKLGKDNVFALAAKDIANLADERGYDTRIFTLGMSTRANVYEAFAEAARELKADGELLVTYCGHGFRRIPGCTLTDTQSWSLSAWQPTEEVVTRKLLSKFASPQRILMINDSCYAGDYGNYKKVAADLRNLAKKSQSTTQKNKLKADLLQFVKINFPGYTLDALMNFMAEPIERDCEGGKTPTCPVMFLQASSAGKIATKALFTNTLIKVITSKRPATYNELIKDANKEMQVQVSEINGDDVDFNGRIPFDK